MTSKHDTSTLSHEFNNIIQDLESMLKEATALGGDEYAHVREILSARIAAAKADMSRLGLNISGKVHASTADMSSEIRNEPWKSVGTAAVVGLLLGVLIARK